jgi:mannitol/fructose-specific phosphotransferase system IIA component (Ntr-type)
MVLRNILTADRIKLGIKDVDKWVLIEELVDLIVNSMGDVDREALIADTFAREEEGSTGLEDGIAIPHARTNGVKGLVGALGISPDGIDFDSADGKPSHLIFLILGQSGEAARYIKAVAQATKLRYAPDRIRRLKEAKSADEVLAILGEVEGGSH